MTTLVDTSVWSLALRRPASQVSAMHAVRHLESLLNDASVVIIGPIRQELLSGISDQTQFDQLRTRLAYLPDQPIDPGDYVTAAAFSNTCRRHGVQGSHTDFLICAVAARNKWPILTTDADFARYAKFIPIDICDAT